MLTKENMFFLVAEWRGIVVGNIIGDLPAHHSRRRARLDSIAVGPRWQARHIGRQLAVRFLAKARRLGYSGITLEVAVPNRTAQQLFRSLGFEKVRRLKRYYSGQIDAFQMVRRFG